VTLRAPPPSTRSSRSTRAARDGPPRPDGSLVAEGRPTQLDLELPEPVSFETATRASAGYVDFVSIPTRGASCAVRCVARRGPGLASSRARSRESASWRRRGGPRRPVRRRGRARPELVWASLDCPSWFGTRLRGASTKILWAIGRPDPAPAPLGGTLRRRGWAIGQEGRRILCGSALFDASGACLASARATWIEVKGRFPVAQAFCTFATSSRSRAGSLRGHRWRGSPAARSRVAARLVDAEAVAARDLSTSMRVRTGCCR